MTNKIAKTTCNARGWWPARQCTRLKNINNIVYSFPTAVSKVFKTFSRLKCRDHHRIILYIGLDENRLFRKYFPEGFVRNWEKGIFQSISMAIQRGNATSILGTVKSGEKIDEVFYL